MELTAKQNKFAVLIAQGFNQSDAYRRAYDCAKMRDKSIWDAASKLRQHPDVSQRIDVLLADAHLDDIMDIRRYARRVLDRGDKAEKQDNYAAAAQYDRLLGQTITALKDKVIEEKPQITDEQLIAALAREDPEKAKALRRIIGADSFEEYDNVVRIKANG